MQNVTLSISEPLKQKMEQLPEINWSELIREFLSEKVKRLLILKKLEILLEKSEEPDKEALRLGKKIKAGMWKKYKKEGW